jgi:type IV pilus assembly protein PilA
MGDFMTGNVSSLRRKDGAFQVFGRDESSRLQKSASGFSLVELLIVVAIILIIAGIAIPDLLRSRIAANQASAVGSIRTIITGENTYAATYGTGYSVTLAQLDGPAAGASNINNAQDIDSVLGSGEKSGYFFYYVSCPTTPGPNTGSMANGTCAVQVYSYQISANSTGGCGTGYGVCYYSDSSGVIRGSTTSYAGPTDAPIGG